MALRHTKARAPSVAQDAPTNAEFVVMSLDGILTQERVLTAGANISIADGGAGGNVTISATGVAPSNASYVVMGLDATLSDERVLTAGANINITDGGAGGNVTIATTGVPTGSGTTDRLSRWTAPTVLGDSLVASDGATYTDIGVTNHEVYVDHSNQVIGINTNSPASTSHIDIVPLTGGAHNEEITIFDATLNTSGNHVAIRIGEVKTAGSSGTGQILRGIQISETMDHNGTSIGVLQGVQSTVIMNDGTISAASLDGSIKAAELISNVTGGTVSGGHFGGKITIGQSAGTIVGGTYGLHIEGNITGGTQNTVYLLYLEETAGVDVSLFSEGIIALSAGEYINWGATFGSGGYGFRDNGGTMEYKDSGGAWAAFASGTLTGSGTNNVISKWTGATSQGDSQLGDDGTTVTFNSATAASKLFEFYGDTNLIAAFNGASEALYFPDSRKLVFGNSAAAPDGEIYSDGSNLLINSNSTADISVESADDLFLQGAASAAVFVNFNQIDCDFLVYDDFGLLASFDAALSRVHIPTNKYLAFGNTAAAPEAQIYHDGTQLIFDSTDQNDDFLFQAGGNPFMLFEGSAGGDCYFNGAADVYLLGGTINIRPTTKTVINSNSVDADTDINGDTTTIITFDAGLEMAQFKQNVSMQGIIDNGGSAYTGGASGSETTIDLSSSDGNTVRLAPASEANAYYALSNPQNWQVVFVHNESSYNAYVVTGAAGGTGNFVIIPPLANIANGRVAAMQYNPNIRNGSGGWTSISVAPKNIVVNLSDAATVAVDASHGEGLYKVTLGGNRTLGNPTNPIGDGQKILFKIEQDGTGSRTLAFDTKYRFSTGLPSPTITTAAGDYDYLGFIYNSTDDTWDYIGEVLGFAS